MVGDREEEIKELLEKMENENGIVTRYAARLLFGAEAYAA